MKTCIFQIALALAFSLPSYSFATLGEPESEISKEANSSRPFYAHTTLNRFNRHTLNEPKLQVNQFASGGRVFAVAWKGKAHPDLPMLLGRHFSEYQAAYRRAKLNRRGHSPIEIEINGIHVEQGGTPRALYGRIWLTALFPTQVDRNEIH